MISGGCEDAATSCSHATSRYIIWSFKVIHSSSLCYRYPSYIMPHRYIPLTPTHHPASRLRPNHDLLEICRGQSLYHTSTLAEPRPEDPVRVLEHAVLQTDYNELRALEASFDESTNVLRVRKIKRCIDFIQDIHGRWLELKKSHDERKRDERSGEQVIVCSMP